MKTQIAKISDMWGVGSIQAYPDYSWIGDKLADLLPHGSGVNYNWRIYQQWTDKSIWYASNTYEAMNEAGFYCHVYDFKCKYRFNYSPIAKCESCSGTGIRLVQELAKYHLEKSYNELIEYLFCRMLYVYRFNDGTDYIVCNYCHGEGFNHLPEFELLNVSFYGQRERSCCGYGLHDYLNDMLYIHVD